MQKLKTVNEGMRAVSGLQKNNTRGHFILLKYVYSLKYEDELKYKDDLKYEDNLKNEDDLKYKDNHL